MINLRMHLFNFKKNLDFETQGEVATIVESHFVASDSESEKKVVKSLNEKLKSYSYDDSVKQLLEGLNTDVKTYQILYDLKDLYKIIEAKNQGSHIYRPVLNTLLQIINTQDETDMMGRIVNELGMHNWVPEVKIFCHNLTASPEKKQNLLGGGKAEAVYTITEKTDDGDIAFIHDSWFLLKEDTIEKTLLENHVKDTDKKNILRNLQTAMKFSTITESRIDFRISEYLTVGISTKNDGIIFLNEEKSNKETTLESLFQSPIIPIVNKNFFPLLKEVANNVDKFVDLDVVRKVENITNPFLSIYAFNYKDNIYSYRIDSRYGNSLYKYESANEVINDIKNELKFDLTYFYENKLSKEMKVKRALEDRERLIKMDLEELDKNIDKVETNIKMVGENKILTDAITMLKESRKEVELDFLAVKALQYKETSKV